MKQGLLQLKLIGLTARIQNSKKEYSRLQGKFIQSGIKNRFPAFDFVIKINGEHIVDVNGEYRDDSDIGKLLRDFFCSDAAYMYFDLMVEGTRYLKENSKEGGRYVPDSGRYV